MLITTDNHLKTNVMESINILSKWLMLLRENEKQI